MVKTIISVYLLAAAILGINASPFVAPKVPLAPKITSKYFWYPTDDGGYVPAMLEGGRKLTRADANNIHYYLYTLDSPLTAYELIVGDEDNLNNAPMVKGAPTKIISHGFNSGASRSPGLPLREAYFKANNNYNIIIIDWSKLAAAPWYDVAAAGTELVGNKTAILVTALVDRGFVTLDQVHVVGHSLGAHVAGWCGTFLGAGNLGRITALDPALPTFGVKPDSERIDRTDAAFVDVIHTAGGSILDGGLAFTDQRGHVDFYPNGGIPHQPGCGGAISDPFGACSHGRCYAYFEESITNPNAFEACLCNNWEDYDAGNCNCTTTAVMGEHVTAGTTGTYYLRTNEAAPFSQS